MIYKIGNIAKVMGVTTEAIRHYERMGLIKPEKDPQTNYRYFTEEQLSQLLYIQRLSQMGISLQLIREQFLNGSLHSYEQVISETLQSTQERLRILQMKTSNLMNCLDILQTAEQSKGRCIYGMRPDMYFISTQHCIQSSFAQEQPKGFHNFSNHADLFFQSVHYYEENGVWRSEKGFGIYKDCAEYAQYCENPYFHLRSAAHAVLCTFDNLKTDAGITETVRSFFREHNLKRSGEVYSRQVYRTFSKEQEPVVMELLAIPYIRI